MASVKLDECLSRHVAPLFAAQGHDVATVTGQGWGGLTDDDLWPRVCGEKRLFITADLDFADARKYPPGTHSGIVVLRAEHESRKSYEVLAHGLLNSIDLNVLDGALAVVSHSGVRIRREPPA